MAFTRNVFQIDVNAWGYEVLQDGFPYLKQMRLPLGGADITTQKIAEDFADLILGKLSKGAFAIIYEEEQRAILDDPVGVDVSALATAAKSAEDKRRADYAATFKRPF